MIKVDISNIDQLRKQFDPEKVDKAFWSALKRTTAKTKTQVSKEIRKIYAIKAGDVNKHVRSYRAQDSYVIDYSGSPISLRKFGAKTRTVSTARGVRKGVSVKVKKTKRRDLVKSGFQISSQKPSPIFKRTGKPSAGDPSREAIAKLFSLSVPQMVNDSVAAKTFDFIQEEANDQFYRAFKFFINR
jgi:hypothetical protein